MTMAGGEELLDLIDKEIPEGRRSLQENYMNLEKVAKYCEENYQKASPAEKSRALQETRDFTTHSLASVAYQINSLATNFLKLLDLQQAQLTDMESGVNHLNQTVMIHKEKVARREIGVLTATRSVPRTRGMKYGIIYPEQPEREILYQRRDIDYNLLDDIGHGVRPQGPTPRKDRSPSVISDQSANSGKAVVYQHGNNSLYSQGPPSNKPPTPPGNRQSSVSSQGGGTIGRAAGSQYRPAVAPPMAPAMPPQAPAVIYAGNDPNRVQSGWMDDLPLPPPVDDDFPDPNMGSPGGPSFMPPPPDMNQFEFPAHPPPEDFTDICVSEETYAVTQGLVRNSSIEHYAPPVQQFPPPAPDWVPQSYMEKVVAIFNYEANKPDELSFSENAIIYVIHKNDDGWWEGVMDGRQGLFPFNYVESCE